LNAAVTPPRFFVLRVPRRSGSVAQQLQRNLRENNSLKHSRRGASLADDNSGIGAPRYRDETH
jgi:hypothetical protein